jgi:poly-beta-1,6-N-acetyl-D-glucosamine synthase
MNILVESLIWIVYFLSLYFSIFFLLVFLDKKNFFKNEVSGTKLIDLPQVSVLVPAYNEEKTVLRTLQSIDAIEYPKDKMEVIIINDGSTDKTEEIVQNYIKDKENFKIISQKNQGKATGLNNALKVVTGEYFACLDADSFVDPWTLRKMLAMYQKSKDDLVIVTPAMKVEKPRNILQRIQWLEYIVIIFIARLTSQLDSLYVAPGPFSLYRTSIIRKIGGFDVKNITEDQEIAYRIQKKNYKIKQCFDGYVYTTAPHKLKPFYQQRRRWYLGSLMCLDKYKDLIANRKYGDFGIFQMLKNALGYFLAIAGILLAFYIFIIPAGKWIKNMFVLKFHFWPFVKAFELKISWMDFLLADFRKGFIIAFLFSAGIYFFYLAHRNAKEKMWKFGWLPIIPYFAFYYMLKGIILLLSLVQFSRKKKIRW